MDASNVAPLTLKDWIMFGITISSVVAVIVVAIMNNTYNKRRANIDYLRGFLVHRIDVYRKTLLTFVLLWKNYYHIHYVFFMGATPDTIHQFKKIKKEEEKKQMCSYRTRWSCMPLHFFFQKKLKIGVKNL